MGAFKCVTCNIMHLLAKKIFNEELCVVPLRKKDRKYVIFDMMRIFELNQGEYNFKAYLCSHKETAFDFEKLVPH